MEWESLWYSAVAFELVPYDAQSDEQRQQLLQQVIGIPMDHLNLTAAHLLLIAKKDSRDMQVRLQDELQANLRLTTSENKMNELRTELEAEIEMDSLEELERELEKGKLSKGNDSEVTIISEQTSRLSALAIDPSETLMTVEFQPSSLWSEKKSQLIFPKYFEFKTAFAVKDLLGSTFALKITEICYNDVQIDREFAALQHLYLHRLRANRGLPEIAVLGSFEFKGEAYKCLLTKPFGKSLEKQLEGLDLDILSRRLESILKDIHFAGIVHGDIKPENVIVSNDFKASTASLIDFGASRFIDCQDKDNIIYTKEYCSIRQRKDSKHLCMPRDDIESLIYTMLSLSSAKGPDSWPWMSADQDLLDFKLSKLEFALETEPSWLSDGMREVIHNVLQEEELSQIMNIEW
jgi:hypothetical protein